VAVFVDEQAESVSVLTASNAKIEILRREVAINVPLRKLVRKNPLILDLRYQTPCPDSADDAGLIGNDNHIISQFTKNRVLDAP
jgi:hypothetical protein